MYKSETDEDFYKNISDKILFLVVKNGLWHNVPEKLIVPILKEFINHFKLNETVFKKYLSILGAYLYAS